MREYGDRVRFVPVRADFGHDQNKPYEQRLAEARPWADEAGVRGPLLVDGDDFPFLRFGRGAVPNWARSEKPGERPVGWGYMYVLDSDGLIVYQHEHEPGFRYYQSRFVLDRLLDADFDRAFREGFPKRGRELPRVEKRDEGVAHIEDFESYEDTYDFRLQPRWGFGPKTWDLVEKFGTLANGRGPDGSRVAVVTGAPPRGMHNMEHALPQPLRKGSIRFHVKRGPQGWNTSDPKRVLAVTVYGPGKKKLGVIDVRGEWEMEAFEVNGTRGKAYLSKSSWHAVEINVTPGAPAKVSVDGKMLGELPRGPVARVGFDCGHHGFMLDDVELFYAR